MAPGPLATRASDFTDRTLCLNVARKEMLGHLQMASVPLFKQKDSPGRTRTCSWTLWTTLWRCEVSVGADAELIAIHLKSQFFI